MVENIISEYVKKEWDPVADIYRVMGSPFDFSPYVAILEFFTASHVISPKTL